MRQNRNQYKSPNQSRSVIASWIASANESDATFEETASLRKNQPLRVRMRALTGMPFAYHPNPFPCKIQSPILSRNKMTRIRRCLKKTWNHSQG